MVGSFPPPLGGAARVNELVRAGLMDAGVQLTALDISGPRLAHSRGPGYHLRRATRNGVALFRARGGATRNSVLYIVPDAGIGIWYTAAHILLASGGFDDVVIHHHSCRYSEEYSAAMARIVRFRPAATTHVFLTAGMATRFQERYGSVRFRIATNACFMTAAAMEDTVPEDGSMAGAPLRLGHLSNLCADKGFFAVADAFEVLRSKGRDVELWLAGPVLEDAVAQRLNVLCARHGSRVTHLGALHGEEKAAFYRSIDLFLFPTEFRQEAAPLVLYEALAAGTPVLARDRGMIAEIVPEGCGAVCTRDANFSAFTEAAMVQLQSWSRDAIKARMRAECGLSIRQYGELLSMLAGRPVAISLGSS